MWLNWKVKNIHPYPYWDYRGDVLVPFDGVGYNVSTVAIFMLQTHAHAHIWLWSITNSVSLLLRSATAHSRLPAYVFMIDADAMAPHECRTIGNHHAVLKDYRARPVANQPGESYYKIYTYIALTIEAEWCINAVN